MSDQRSAIAEFRELEQRRLAGGLTTAEVARYDWLRRVLGNAAATGPAGGGFNMGSAAADLHESLLSAGLRGRPPEPEPEPIALDGPAWDDLTSEAATQAAPFPAGGLDAGWLSEDEEEAPAPPPAPPSTVRPQAWNPAAPGYDPDAPFDEAAWIAAGYDPNVVYDWSSYGAQDVGADAGGPAATAKVAASPGEVVTSPAIPLPSTLSSAMGPLDEEDLPTLDVLSPEEPAADADVNPVATGLSAVAAFPITDAFLAPDPTPPAAPPAPPAEQATFGDDDGWPGFETDPVAQPPVAPAAAVEAGSPNAPEPLTPVTLDELPPLDLAAEPEVVAPPAPAAPAGEEPVAFDDLLSDDELQLLASGGGVIELDQPAAEQARPVPVEPLAPPREAEAISLELLELEPSPPAPLPAVALPAAADRSPPTEPAPIPPFEPALHLPELALGEAELPALALEPVQGVLPEPFLAAPEAARQEAVAPEAEADPLHPPLPEAIRANVFVPKAPVFAAPAWPAAVEALHPPLPDAVQANVFVPPAPVLAPQARAVAEPHPAWTEPPSLPEPPRFEADEVEELFDAALPPEPAPAPAPAAEVVPAPAAPVEAIEQVWEAAPIEAAEQPVEEAPLLVEAELETPPLPEVELPVERAPGAEPPPVFEAELAVERPAPPEAASAAELFLPTAPEPALPERLPLPQELPAEPVVGQQLHSFDQGWPAEAEPLPPEPLPTVPLAPVAAPQLAPAQAFAPPAWPLPAAPPAAGRAPAPFGDYDEAAPASGRFVTGPPLADPLAGAWDSGGDPLLDPAIQPYEPAPPGAPLGEYDDLPSPSARGLETMLPFDPGAAAAIRPGSVPEGYESSPADEAHLAMGLELPGRPVGPPSAGPVAELAEVSAEWQPDAALERGFDLASDGSFGLPELNLGETPAWPPPGPPSPPPIALAPPAPHPLPAPTTAPATPPATDDGFELLGADDVIEQPETSPDVGPAAPAAPPLPPLDVFVAPAAGLFAAAARTPAPARPATTPRPSTSFVAPSAKLFSRPEPAGLPPPGPSRTGELELGAEPARAPAVPPRPAPVVAPPAAIEPFEIERSSPLAAVPSPAEVEQVEPPALETTPNVGMPLEASPGAPAAGRWSSSAAPVVPRLKATQPPAPPVAAPPAAPELDLEPLPPLLPVTRFEGSHRVLVHTIDGEVKRGVLQGPVLDSDQLTLLPQGPGTSQVLPTAAIKAVFFLLGAGEQPPGPDGRKVRVTFRDGRQVVGFSPDYTEGQVGFLLIPAEARTTTARIWVYQASVRQVVVC